MSFSQKEPVPIRLDGRTAFELRPPSVQFSFSKRCEGSARFFMGTSGVVVCVNGPTNCPLHSKTILDRAYIEIAVQPSSGRSSSLEKTLEVELLKCAQSCINVHCYPRTMLRINVQILASDGSLGSVAINGMILALLDSGLQMHCTPFAVSIGLPFSSSATSTPAQGDTQESTIVSDLSKSSECHLYIDLSKTPDPSLLHETEAHHAMAETAHTQSHTLSQPKRRDTLIPKSSAYLGKEKLRWLLDPIESEIHLHCESVLCYVLYFQTGDFLSSFTEWGSGVFDERALLFALASVAISTLGKELRLQWEASMKEIVNLFEANNQFDTQV
ncbi:3' exoribonuclease family, domain 1 domain-containing protein [Cardiosporidium cionae]|uniref:3' exoribonuclease family, domain 1 domain-containing protein n=1 Tax=Cardiosporidium cionae TaxID=476202 RepID=A0ABQ7JFS9_9APIC|nr:3' exoribonuclease family, domain 1 domain-containing protein [Cardiosporidium cionae]|eukprot:KAF8822853.1 3' exoribonuclease family, domain 1 domain-containing protein [Cardiosporidium cionae]